MKTFAHTLLIVLLGWATLVQAEPQNALFDRIQQTPVVTTPKAPILTLVAAYPGSLVTYVRDAPNFQAPIIDELLEPFHCRFDGVLIQKCGDWSLIKLYDVIGYVHNSTIDELTWYRENSEYVLVTDKDWTPIYIESNIGPPLSVFTYVTKGTIVATYDPSYIEYNNNHYYLKTCHDYYAVKKSDCKKVPIQDLR